MYFENNMTNECDQRRYFKNYCKIIVEKNLDLVNKIDDEKFIFFDNAVDVIIHSLNMAINYKLIVDAGPDNKEQRKIS